MNARSSRLHPKWVAITSYVVSALLYLISTYADNIRVETVQPNGLAEVQYPYLGVFLLPALEALFFAITLSIVVLLGRTAMPGRALLGSGLFSAGVLAILFAVFLYSVNLQDVGPRCLGGCAPSLQQYIQGVLAVSTVIAVSGLFAAGFGARLLIRGDIKAKAERWGNPSKDQFN
jgi:hypothetical protein